MPQISGLSMKDVLLSSNPVNTMLGSFQKTLRNVIQLFSQVIPSKTISLEMIKSDVWRDLSLVYYKYEDGAQKKAFRDILSEISERILEGNWDSVYRKLHSMETNPTTIRL